MGAFFRSTLAIVMLTAMLSHVFLAPTAAREEVSEIDVYPELTYSPEFEETDCDYSDEVIPASLDAENIECGVVAVPVDHDDPDGDTLDIFVTKLPSTSRRASGTPLFVLAGGPGQAGSDIFFVFDDDVDEPMASWSPLVTGRDVYLIDQRGTGRTSPDLVCPADRVVSNASGTPVPDDQYANAETAGELYGDCAETLADEGYDLEFYTTRQSAADLDVVREAIGERRVDLLGTSYGSWLALEMMRFYPDSIGSVILNSPSTPQESWFGGLAEGFQRSLDAVYDGCANDEDCDAAYPDLERLLLTTVRELNQDPIAVTYLNPETGKDETSLADGDILLRVVYQLLFGSYAEYIAPLVGSVANGDTELFGLLVPVLISSDDGVGTPLHYAVLCQEELPFNPSDEVAEEAEDAGASKLVIDDAVTSAQSYEGVCDEWDLPVSDEIMNEPVESDIPTLIFTGTFDPITPVFYGEELLETLSSATLVESPIAGHNPASNSGTCGVDIMVDFLDDPDAAVDATCLDDMSMDFSPA